jgi:hypothetical protein
LCPALDSLRSTANAAKSEVRAGVAFNYCRIQKYLQQRGPMRAPADEHRHAEERDG